MGTKRDMQLGLRADIRTRKVITLKTRFDAITRAALPSFYG
ncbi:hypothetical protein [Spirosoma aerophilum]